MKRKVMIVCAAFVLLCQSASGKSVDWETPEATLSKCISEIVVTNGNQVLVRLLERPTDIVVFNQRTHRHLQFLGKEELVLKVGDSFSFQMAEGVSEVLNLVVTNGLDSTFGTVFPACKENPLYLVLKRHHRPHPHSTQTPADRDFVIDVRAGRVYDIQKKTIQDFAVPFHSLWKDWTDYWVNFSGVPQPDIEGEALRFVRQQLQRIRDSVLVKEFVARQKEGSLCPLIYLVGDAGWCTNAVLIRKTGRTNAILGLAQFNNMGDRIVYILDYEEHLRWYYHSFRLSGQDCYFEFSGGRIVRFVEVDRRERPLPRMRRLNKRDAMVDASEMSVFLEEAKTAIRPLIEAWRTNRMIPVVEESSKSQPDENRAVLLDEAIRSAQSWQQEQERRRSAQYTRLNEDRRARGMPDLGEKEKRLLERQEMLAAACKRMETLRQMVSGRTTTSPHDALIDQERARLYILYTTIRWGYDLRTPLGEKVKYPEKLRDVLGVTLPRTRIEILPEGECALVDSWGRDYDYSSTHKGLKGGRADLPLIRSAGPDGVFDTEDDLTSVDERLLQRQIEKKGLKFSN